MHLTGCEFIVSFVLKDNQCTIQKHGVAKLFQRLKHCSLFVAHRLEFILAPEVY
jgi:hypothetical protein